MRAGWVSIFLMWLLEYFLKEIEHCSRHASPKVVYEVLAILYDTLRALRTLYYESTLAPKWGEVPTPASASSL